MSNNANGYDVEVLECIRDNQREDPSRASAAPKEGSLTPTFDPNTGTFTMSRPRVGYSIANGTVIPYYGELPSCYTDGTLEPCAADLFGKRVVLVGLGSAGSAIAVQLAAAGVSHFDIWDNDVWEKQNLSRAVAGISDVGERKVNVAEHLIREKNPVAKVVKHDADVMLDSDAFEAAVKDCDVVGVCTDNNESRFFIDDIAREHKKIAVFARAFARAEGGDAFLSVPDGVGYAESVKMMACGREVVLNENQGRRRGDIPAYASEEDVGIIVQPGLGVDVMPIIYWHLKLILMVLAKGTPSELKSFQEETEDNNYFFWGAVRREGNPFEHFAPMCNPGDRPCCFRWYGMRLTAE